MITLQVSFTKDSPKIAKKKIYTEGLDRESRGYALFRTESPYSKHTHIIAIITLVTVLTL